MHKHYVITKTIASILVAASFAYDVAWACPDAIRVPAPHVVSRNTLAPAPASQNLAIINRIHYSLIATEIEHVPISLDHFTLPALLRKIEKIKEEVWFKEHVVRRETTDTSIVLHLASGYALRYRITEAVATLPPGVRIIESTKLGVLTKDILRIVSPDVSAVPPSRDLCGPEADPGKSDEIVQRLIQDLDHPLVQFSYDPVNDTLTQPFIINWVEGYKPGITPELEYRGASISIDDTLSPMQQERAKAWLRNHWIDTGQDGKKVYPCFRVAIHRNALYTDTRGINHAYIAHAGYRDRAIYIGQYFLVGLLSHPDDSLIKLVLDDDEFKHLRDRGFDCRLDGDMYRLRWAAVADTILTMDSLVRSFKAVVASDTPEQEAVQSLAAKFHLIIKMAEARGRSYADAAKQMKDFIPEDKCDYAEAALDRLADVSSESTYYLAALRLAYYGIVATGESFKRSVIEDPEKYTQIALKAVDFIECAFKDEYSSEICKNEAYLLHILTIFEQANMLQSAEAVIDKYLMFVSGAKRRMHEKIWLMNGVYTLHQLAYRVKDALGKSDECIALADVALRRFTQRARSEKKSFAPDMAECMAYKGRSYYRKNDFENAARCFAAAIQWMEEYRDARPKGMSRVLSEELFLLATMRRVANVLIRMEHNDAARRYIDETIALGENERLWSHAKDEAAHVFGAAAEAYLGSPHLSRERTAKAEDYLEKAVVFGGTGAHLTALLAWLQYEKNDIEASVAALGMFAQSPSMTEQDLYLFAILSESVARLLKRDGRLDEARVVAGKALRSINAARTSVIVEWPKLEMVEAGLLEFTESIDAAIARFDELIAASKKEGKHACAILTHSALVHMMRAVAAGDIFTPEKWEGALPDYVTPAIEAFTTVGGGLTAIDSQYRWFPKEDRELFGRLLWTIADSELPQIPHDAQANMLYFLNIVRPEWLSPVKVLTVLERVQFKSLKIREQSRRKGAATGDQNIETFIEEVKARLTPSEHMEYIRSLIVADRLEDARRELERLRGNLGDDADAGLREDRGHYLRAVTHALGARSAYLRHMYDEATKEAEVAINILRDQVGREGLRIDHLDCLEELCDFSQKMSDAQGLYEYADTIDDANDAAYADAEAVKLAEAVGDKTAREFMTKVDVVQCAQGLINTDPDRALKLIAPLMPKYPEDDRIIRIYNPCLKIVARKKGAEKALNYELTLLARYADQNEYENVLESLRRIVFGMRDLDPSKASGMRKTVLKILESAAKAASEECEFIYSLEMAQEGLLISPENREFTRIIAASNAQAAVQQFSRHDRIISAQVEAGVLRDDETRRALHTTQEKLEFVARGVIADPARGTITISSVALITGSAGNQTEFPIANVREAIRVGATYAVSFGVQRGDLFFMKARDVFDSSAVFEMDTDEDNAGFFKNFPLPNGQLIITKVADPSLLARRSLLDRIISSLTATVGGGAVKGSRTSVTTGYLAIDNVIGLRPPPPEPKEKPLPMFFNTRIEADPAQKAAVTAALDPDLPVTLIQGPPGTGKTSVIEEIVIQYARLGKKVLVVSQANPAVDNIGLRLLAAQGRGILKRFVRVGNNEASIDERLRENWAAREKTLQDMGERQNEGVVVLGTTNGFFSDKYLQKNPLIIGNFDVVIIEEAGRATLAETLLPISHAKPDGKVILVGDHRQLPAYGIDQKEVEEIKALLEKYERATPEELHEIFKPSRILEYRTSLFETMWEHMPQFTGRYKHLLLINRRSHPAIAQMESLLFYDGKIQVDPTKDPAIDPRNPPLTLIDYGRDVACAAKKLPNETSLFNPTEAGLVLKEIDRYLNVRKSGGVFRYSPGNITVITPYMKQIGLIRDVLEAKAILGDIRAGQLEAEAACSEEKIARLLAIAQTLSKDAGRQINCAMFNEYVNDMRIDYSRREQFVLNVANMFSVDVLCDSNGRTITYEDLKGLHLLDVETVDSIQGSENDVVIVSLVQSNKSGSIGFMGTEDGLQRLNVAFSRAREAMTVIGDFTNTLTKATYQRKLPDDHHDAAVEHAIAESTRRAQWVFRGMVAYIAELNATGIIPRLTRLNARHASIDGSEPDHEAGERSALFGIQETVIRPGTARVVVGESVGDRSNTGSAYGKDTIPEWVGSKKIDAHITRIRSELASLGFDAAEADGMAATVREALESNRYFIKDENPTRVAIYGYKDAAKPFRNEESVDLKRAIECKGIVDYVVLRTCALVGAGTEIALLTPDRKKIVLERRAFNPYKGTYGLPGGTIEGQEAFEVNARTEIREELGLSGEPRGTLIPIDETYFSNMLHGRFAYVLTHDEYAEVEALKKRIDGLKASMTAEEFDGYLVAQRAKPVEVKDRDRFDGETADIQIIDIDVFLANDFLHVHDVYSDGEKDAAYNYTFDTAERLRDDVRGDVTLRQRVFKAEVERDGPAQDGARQVLNTLGARDQLAGRVPQLSTDLRAEWEELNRANALSYPPHKVACEVGSFPYWDLENSAKSIAKNCPTAQFLVTEVMENRPIAEPMNMLLRILNDRSIKKKKGLRSFLTNTYVPGMANHGVARRVQIFRHTFL